MSNNDSLKLHDLRPAPGAKTSKTRVGRGEASKGKTAGRGTKGTKARYQVPHGFEGGQTPMHMRLPKLRGFKNPTKVTFQVVNLDKLSTLFPEGGDVTVADLVAKRAVRPQQPVKVLGTGEITVALNITSDKFSGSAAEKISAAGGSDYEDGLDPALRQRGFGMRGAVTSVTAPCCISLPRPAAPGRRPEPSRRRPSSVST